MISLINWGLNMVGNPPSGGIFQTAAKEAQKPFQQFQKSRAQESLGRRELIANMVQNMSEDDKYKLQVEAQHIFEAGAELILLLMHLLKVLMKL